MRIPLLIVGAGMVGLSAAWRLDKAGFRDFALLEMAPQAGGNARWGENEISAYPWASHYVPIPNRKSALVRELFEELGLLHDGKLAGGPAWDNVIYDSPVLGYVVATHQSLRSRVGAQRVDLLLGPGSGRAGGQPEAAARQGLGLLETGDPQRSGTCASGHS